MEADVRDALMKQKHRHIWERRNPEIMSYRDQQLAEHKKKFAEGDMDFEFWKNRILFQVSLTVSSEQCMKRRYLKEIVYVRVRFC